METPAITVHTRLTRTSYRKYMYFHVFRKDSAWLKFTAMCLLVLLFGLINFRTGSPGLGWVFVLLAAYLLVSRYLRFFLSLNRICSQYGLDSLPRTFYSITFSPSGLDTDICPGRQQQDRACFLSLEAGAPCLPAARYPLSLYESPDCLSAS